MGDAVKGEKKATFLRLLWAKSSQECAFTSALCLVITFLCVMMHHSTE